MKNQNLKSLMLATVFTLLTAGLALAQPPQQRDQKQTPPEPSEILKKLDTNEDGKISKEEVKGPLKKQFAKIDTDEDGFLTLEELKKAPRPNGKKQKPSK